MPLPLSDGIFKKFNLNLLSRNTPAQNYGYITVISETAFYHIHNIIIVTFFRNLSRGWTEFFLETGIFMQFVFVSSTDGFAMRTKFTGKACNFIFFSYKATKSEIKS